MKNEQLIKQGAIDKLTLIANNDYGVQLTSEEANYLSITSIDDESIIKDQDHE